MDRRFIINLAGNLASFVISLLVSMWIAPFIIGRLGADAYGFIPLSQQIINYMTVITIALNGMFYRFFTVSLKSGDVEAANKYFNTSFFASLIIAIVIFSVILSSTIFINKIINIPDRLLVDVKITFLIIGASFVLNMLFDALSIATYCENRLDLNSLASIVTVLARTLLVIILLNIFTPRIWFTGLATLISSLVFIAMNYYFFKKLLPEIKVNPLLFNFKKLKELVSSGIWNSINYIGAILYLQIDMLVANWYLGPLIAGEYSAVLQWSGLLRGFTSSITSVFSPTIMKLYAEDKTREMVDYSNFSVRITGIIIALPIGIICGLSDRILFVWLGEGFVKYSYLLMLMVYHLTINLSVQSLFTLFPTTNKMKLPAIVTLIMGLFNLILAIILTKYFNMGVYGIVLAGTIMLTAKNLIFTPLYCAKITNQKLNAYFKGILQPVFAVTCFVIFCFVVKGIINITNWGSLIAVVAFISIIYVIASFFAFLSKAERTEIISMLLRKISKAF